MRNLSDPIAPDLLQRTGTQTAAQPGGHPVKLSVIVPVYNVEAYIVACLDTLLDQGLTDADYEIICVDNGSIDRSYAILADYAQRFRQIRVIRLAKADVSTARNTGLRSASGEYVYFMDSDDLLAQNALAALYRLAVENDLDLLLFDYARFDDGTAPPLAGQTVDPRRLTLFQNPIVLRQDKRVPEWRVVWNYLVRLSVLRSFDLTFLEGTIFEDQEFNFWLDHCAASCGYLNQKLYGYRQRENSLLRSYKDGEGFSRYIQSRLKMAASHQARLQDFRAGIPPKLHIPITEAELEDRMIDEVQGTLNRLLQKNDQALFDETLAALKAQGLYPYPLRWRRLFRQRPFNNHVIDAVSFLFPVQGYLRLCAWLRALLPLKLEGLEF